PCARWRQPRQRKALDSARRALQTRRSGQPRLVRGMSMQDKVLVAQGGGPTVVINQSLAGVVLEARKFQHIGRIYGARHGVRGLIDEDLVDLTRETSHNLEMVALTPSAALGSTRDK